MHTCLCSHCVYERAKCAAFLFAAVCAGYQLLTASVIDLISYSRLLNEKLFSRLWKKKVPLCLTLIKLSQALD